MGLVAWSTEAGLVRAWVFQWLTLGTRCIVPTRWEAWLPSHPIGIPVVAQVCYILYSVTLSVVGDIYREE